MFFKTLYIYASIFHENRMQLILYLRRSHTRQDIYVHVYIYIYIHE